MSEKAFPFYIKTFQHLKLLGRAMFMWIGLYAIMSFEKFPFQVFIYAGCVLFILDTLPNLIVHIQYWLKNRKAVLYINVEEKTILYKSSGYDITGNFQDIKCFSFYSIYGSERGFYSYGVYKYCKIDFHNGKSIIATVLMIPNVEITLQLLLKIQPERHKKFVFCFAK